MVATLAKNSELKTEQDKKQNYRHSIRAFF